MFGPEVSFTASHVYMLQVSEKVQATEADVEGVAGAAAPSGVSKQIVGRAACAVEGADEKVIVSSSARATLGRQHLYSQQVWHTLSGPGWQVGTCGLPAIPLTLFLKLALSASSLCAMRD